MNWCFAEEVNYPVTNNIEKTEVPNIFFMSVITTLLMSVGPQALGANIQFDAITGPVKKERVCELSQELNICTQGC